MISVVQFGAIAYADGLRLQQKLVDLRKSGQIGDVLLLLEHTPVITLGRNARSSNVLASADQLAARGVEVFECDRGGDVTFHGPGQVVGYPIFDLRGFPRNPSPVTREPSTDSVTLPFDRKTLGAVDYVRRLEEVLIRTCADFGIAAKRAPGLTGVWTDPSTLSSNADSSVLSSRAEENDSQNRSLDSRDLVLPALNSEAKIAAIGVHISRSVTSHGFALNVNTDLSFFDLIVPCGITSKPVTSMQKELGRELDIAAVAESLSRNFGVVFTRQMLWVETIEALLGQTVGVPMKPPKQLRQMHGDSDQHLA